MDNFYEHMIKREKNFKDRLIVLGWIFAGIFATILFLFIAILFAHPIAFSTFIAVDAIAWYFVYVLITRRNIEYELSFTNGELDVDAIYSKKRRVHILSTRVREFEICAAVNDNNFNERFSDVKGLKKIYSAQSQSKNATVYFADFYLNAEKVRLVFEPSIKMIRKMKLYNERHIHIKED